MAVVAMWMIYVTPFYVSWLMKKNAAIVAAAQPESWNLNDVLMGWLGFGK